jgi:hypothetical protein
MSVQRWFLVLAGVFLAVAGTAKLWSTFGHSGVLQTVDPIIGLKFASLMRVVAFAELATAALCFSGRKPELATILVAWLGTSFMLYRIGLWCMNWQRPCGCLGNLTDALHISPATADNVMKAVIIYLLGGSYSLLIRKWRPKPISRVECLRVE